MQRKLDLIACETNRLNILQEDQASQKTVLDSHVKESTEKLLKAQKRDKLQYYKERRAEEDREEAAQTARTGRLISTMHSTIGETENVTVNSSIMNVLTNFQSK